MEAKLTAKRTEAPKPAARARPGRSFLRNDFPVIQDAVIALTLSLLLGGAAVYASSDLRSRWQQMEALREQERRQAQARLDEAIVERREILTYQAAFEQMKRDGLVGEETRLDLMERLQQTRDTKRLLSFTYTVTPQKVLEIDPSVMTGSMALRASELILNMPLLHERDLLSLLGTLKGNGMFAPEACNLKRLERSQSGPLDARVQADCTVYWLTIGQRTGARGVEPPTGG